MPHKNTNTQWKRFAWNGIQIEIPQEWEIMELDRTYVFLGQPTGFIGPALELKWSPAPPSYSIQREFLRIQKKGGGRRPWRIREMPLPKEWQQSNEALPVGKKTAIGYSWKAETNEGTGFLCHIPASNLAMLARFYSTIDPAVIQKCIRSLGFPKNRDSVLWSLYDFEAKTPAEFLFTKYQFHTGEFKLTFRRGKSLLTLWRWSPASVLVEEKGLEAFTRKRFGLHGDFDRFETIEVNGWEGLQWQQNHFAGKRMFPFFKRLFPHKNETGLIWQQADKNKLLAVHMKNGQEMDLEMIRSISTHFQCNRDVKAIGV